MASDVAHKGIRKILNLLEEFEVKQLAVVTTQNHLKFEGIRSREGKPRIL